VHRARVGVAAAALVGIAVFTGLVVATLFYFRAEKSRAEKSKTRRHLTEFWMVEPEVAYAIELAERMTIFSNSYEFPILGTLWLPFGDNLVPADK
jgi:hypothetical protein